MVEPCDLSATEMPWLLRATVEYDSLSRQLLWNKGRETACVILAELLCDFLCARNTRFPMTDGPAQWGLQDSLTYRDLHCLAMPWSKAPYGVGASELPSRSRQPNLCHDNPLDNVVPPSRSGRGREMFSSR
jgi:hypothetical protein